MSGFGKWGSILIAVTCLMYLVSAVPAVLMDPVITAFSQLRQNAAVATPPLVTLQEPETSGTLGVTSGKKAK